MPLPEKMYHYLKRGEDALDYDSLTEGQQIKVVRVVRRLLLNARLMRYQALGNILDSTSVDYDFWKDLMK